MQSEKCAGICIIPAGDYFGAGIAAASGEVVKLRFSVCNMSGRDVALVIAPQPIIQTKCVFPREIHLSENLADGITKHEAVWKDANSEGSVFRVDNVWWYENLVTKCLEDGEQLQVLRASTNSTQQSGVNSLRITHEVWIPKCEYNSLVAVVVFRVGIFSNGRISWSQCEKEIPVTVIP